MTELLSFVLNNHIKEFVCELMNNIEKTNSYFITDSKEGLDLYSPETKTGIICITFDYLNDSNIEINRLLFDVKHKIDLLNEKEIKRLIIVSNFSENNLISDYVLFVNAEENYNFFIDFYGIEKIEKYLVVKEYLFEKYFLQTKNKVNQQLTEIPDIKLKNCVGFENHLTELESLLNKKNTQLINIYHPVSGMGKSTLAKMFLRKPDVHKKYNYLAWINIKQNVFIDFVAGFLNSGLYESYNYSFSIANNLKYLAEKINKLPGHKIFVFDNVSNINQLNDISELQKIIQAKFIVISNQQFKNIQSIRIDKLPDLQAKKLFYNNYSLEKNDFLVEIINQKIHNNPFVIQLISKYANAHKLDIKQIFDLISQHLNIVYHLNTYIHNTLARDEEKQLRDCLKAIIAIFEHARNNFTETDKLLLSILGVFPSGNFSLNDIVRLFKLEKIENKLFDSALDFINKGWIRSEKNSLYNSYLLRCILNKRFINKKKIQLTYINYLSELYQCKDNYNDAHLLNYYLVLFFIDNSDEITPIYSKLFTLLFDYLGKTGSFDFMSELMDKAIELDTKLLNNNPKSDVINENLSKKYMIAGKFDKSLFYLEEALKIRKLNFQPDSAIMGHTYKSLAILYDKTGNTVKAAEYLDLAINIYKINKINYHELDYLIELHKIYSYKILPVSNIQQKKEWFKKYFN